MERMWDKEMIALFSAKRWQNTMKKKNWNSCLGPQIAVHVA